MSATSVKITEDRPWEKPWWKPSKDNYLTFVYIITLHILAILGLCLYPLPSLRIGLISLVLAVLGGVGTSVCYHRALAHRSLKLHWTVEHFLIFFTILNGNGSPLTWVANHRNHHAKADTIEDVSSPRHGGFWWAHLRWVYQWPASEVKRWCPDMDKKIYRFWNASTAPIIFFALILGLAWGWEGFFWLGAIRMIYSLHFQMVVNSVLHLSPGAPMGEDSSRNIWWLGPLQLGAWGENWHHNHHNAANIAKFSRHWAQVDVGWYLIWALERVGLAWDVRRPRKQ
jgi:fatty-acid desaturase